MSVKHKAILLMVLSVLCISVMDAAAKDLVGKYPIMPLLAVRAAMVVAVLAAFGLWKHGLRPVGTRRPGLQIIRMVTAVATPAFNFLALKSLPLTDATVIFFGGVFITAALSRPLLGERIGLHKTAAIIVGFAGVIIVVQPEFGSLRIGAIYALMAALSYGLYIILGRKLSDTESTFSLVFFGNFGVLLGGTAFLPAQWVPINGSDMALISVMAAAGLGSHILLVKAFSMADVGTLSPFEYTGVLWAVLFGYFLFEEIPSPAVITGGMIVVASGLYVIYRSRRGLEREETGETALSQTAGD